MRQSLAILLLAFISVLTAVPSRVLFTVNTRAHGSSLARVGELEVEIA
jgi:hypothetical protein